MYYYIVTIAAAFLVAAMVFFLLFRKKNSFSLFYAILSFAAVLFVCSIGILLQKQLQLSPDSKAAEAYLDQKYDIHYHYLTEKDGICFFESPDGVFRVQGAADTLQGVQFADDAAAMFSDVFDFPYECFLDTSTSFSGVSGYYTNVRDYLAASSASLIFVTNAEIDQNALYEQLATACPVPAVNIEFYVLKDTFYNKYEPGTIPYVGIDQQGSFRFVKTDPQQYLVLNENWD